MHNSVKVTIALLLGSSLGILINLLRLSDHIVTVSVVRWVVQPIGELFLSLLFMIVLPLIVAALIGGVAEAGRGGMLKRMGLACLGYTLLTSTISVIIGVVLVSAIAPGSYLSEDVRSHLVSSLSQNFLVQPAVIFTENDGQSIITAIIRAVVPRNPVAAFAQESPNLLQVMFFSLILGIFAATSSSTKVDTFLRAVEGLYELTAQFIDRLMKYAHYPVGCLMFQAAIASGLDLMVSLGAFIGTVILALIIHSLGTYSLLLYFVAKKNPLTFFRAVKPAILTAFATSSSAATLPTTLRVAEENLGLPQPVSSFVLTVGATANQNGTALFEGIAVLFLAQLAGVELGFAEQGLVMYLALLGGLGSAAVPSGSLPFIAGILSVIGVSPALVAVILGVDRILDMCRTAVNVTGDMVIATLVHRTEGGGTTT
jgi:dicarboxylate/amino acid:cation (Na+ or H+) symporter, DAACS family